MIFPWKFSIFSTTRSTIFTASSVPRLPVIKSFCISTTTKIFILCPSLSLQSHDSVLSNILQFFQLLQPDTDAGIARHPQISAGRHCDASHFRTVRQTGTFELLSEKSSVKNLQPFEDHFLFILSLERILCHPVQLLRLIRHTHHIIQEKVMQFVRSYQILRLL